MPCDPKHKEPIEEPIIVPDDAPITPLPKKEVPYEPYEVPA